MTNKNDSAKKRDENAVRRELAFFTKGFIDKNVEDIADMVHVVNTTNQERIIQSIPLIDTPNVLRKSATVSNV